MDGRLMPVAARVKIPQLGERTIGIRPASKIVEKRTTNLDKDQGEVSVSFLRHVSKNFTFTEDVVRERGPETFPYRFYPESELFQAMESSRSLPKTRNRRGHHSAHISCCFLQGEAVNDHPGCIAKTKEAFQLHLEPQRLKSREKKRRQSSHVTSALNGTNKGIVWEEYILDKLSLSAAEHLAHKASGEERERLFRILAERREQTKSSLSAPESGVLPSHIPNGSHTGHDNVNEPLVGLTAYTQSGEPKQRDYKDDIIRKGAFPIYQRERDIIRLNNKLEYEKQLRISYPQEPKSYSDDVKQLKSPNCLVKGHQRWRELPVLLENETGRHWNPPTQLRLQSSSRVDKAHRRKLTKTTSAIQIAEELHAHWGVKPKWTSTTIDQLSRDMKSINDPTRIAAISACAYATRLGLNINDSALPPVLQQGITDALNDKNERVRMAAAVTLFTLDMPSPQGRDVLLETLNCGGQGDSWTAAQCLARVGIGEIPVIQELVRHLTSDGPKHQIAAKLLIRLSHKEALVQALVAEQLNSTSWQERAASCSLIPSLRPPISKEVTEKIVDLMWNDWSDEVRQLAGQALGRTGNGKLVHDALRLRLMADKEMVKLDALKKIGSLGLMTGRLLPSFLLCFKSKYISIRTEAVRVAGQLCIQDNQVISCLMKLMDDSISKVKAHAIQSLGLIGATNLMLTDKLLWSVRFEKDPTVRAEACHTLRLIRPEDERIIPYLKDLLLTDTDPTVRNEAAMALKAIGDCPTADEGIGHQVRAEVKKLGTVSAITRSILAADSQDKMDRHRRRLLGRTRSENGGEKEPRKRLGSLIEDGGESTADTELLELAEMEEDGQEGEVMSEEDFLVGQSTGIECLGTKHAYGAPADETGEC